MAKNTAIVVAALLVFAAAFVLKESQNRDSGTNTEQVSADKPLPRLVDLGSDKCLACKRMAPILEELSKEYRSSLVVEFFDVRKDPALGKEWGVRIIPTQVFLDASGTERFRHEGFMGKEAILGKWKELGVELGTPAPGAGA